jgi:general secretion pathway protein B
MSFILDALKKSENDRQRQSGPALFEVKLAPPRTGLPPWAIAIAALLLVNLGLGLWMLLRHPPARTPEAPPATAERAAPSPAAAAGQAVASSSASGEAPLAPAAVLPALAAAPAPLAAPPPAASPPAPAPRSSSRGGPSAPAAVAGVGGGASGPGNPDDYAPASEPAAATTPGAHVRRGTADGVPLYQEAAASADAHLPPLRLDLHVFAPRTQDRFIMINMHRLHEGDSLPEGVRVESITPDGAVLSYNGSRFLLPRE